MTFSNKIFELQEKYPQDVILIKNGIFFIAVGKDALFLNKIINLKCTCFGNEICKVGFLVKSAELYIEKMKKTGISFKMYLLDSNKEEELIFENKGNLDKPYILKSIGCDKCNKKKASDEDIIEKLKIMNKN